MTIINEVSEISSVLDMYCKKINAIKVKHDSFTEKIYVNNKLTRIKHDAYFEIVYEGKKVDFIPYCEFLNDVDINSLKDLKQSQIYIGINKIADTKGKKYISCDLIKNYLYSNNEYELNLLTSWIFNYTFEMFLEANLNNNYNNFKMENKDKDGNIANNEKVVNKVKNEKCSKNVKVDSVVDFLKEAFNLDFYYDKKEKCYVSCTNKIGVIYMESKDYFRTSYNYWYTYHPHQKASADHYENSYLVLRFKGEQDALIIPIDFINNKLYLLGTSPNVDINGNKSVNWHIHIKRVFQTLLLRIPNRGLEDITEYRYISKINDQHSENKQENNGDKVIKIKGTFKTIKG